MRAIGLAADGAPGHGPVQSLLKSAAGLGFFWHEGSWDWDRPGLPVLSLLAGSTASVKMITDLTGAVLIFFRIN